MGLCDVLSVEARRSQSVNTLMRQPDGAIFGHNTDGNGLVQHLLSANINLKGKHAIARRWWSSQRCIICFIV